MSRMRLVENTLSLYSRLFEHSIRPGDTVVDATAGNGHDTLALARLVGDSGCVHAIDIQPEALRRTRERLAEQKLISRVILHHMDHGTLDGLGLVDVSLAVFNLGYLPGGDKSLATASTSTRAAVKACMQALRPWGAVLITVYPGSPDGYAEHSTLQKFWPTIDQNRFDVIQLSFPNRKNHSPYGIIIQKLDGEDPHERDSAKGDSGNHHQP